MFSARSLSNAALFLIALAMTLSSAWADDNRYIIEFTPGQSAQGKAAVRAFGGNIHVDLSNRGANLVAATLPPQALRGLQRNPNVARVSPDNRVYPMGDRVPYGIPMVQADLVSDAYAAERMICIIDSGYWRGHEDLQSAAVTASPDRSSGDPFIDPCGHGTHVAGTIAALANDRGVIGVLPSGLINLHIVKVFGDNDWRRGSCGYSYSSTVLAAGYQCVDAGANVINMSLGTSASSAATANGWQDIFENHDVLPVAAAGNAGNSTFSYPASYDAVMSVAAVDANGQRAWFSQFNSQVELSAPGVSVTSTVPNVNRQGRVSSGYASWNGTSMAAPHVAAVAALVWSYAPELSAAEIRRILNTTARDLGRAGRDNEYGHGLVQALAALNYLEENFGLPEGDDGNADNGAGDDVIGDDDEQPPATPPEDEDEDEDQHQGISVGQLSAAVRARGPWRSGEVVVTVVDASGNPVSDAVITGNFSGGVSGQASSQTTGSDGMGLLESERIRSNNLGFTFCVTDISASGKVFEAGSNDCVSI